MTALRKYQKLEGTGLWRETPEAQRREVVVAFGDASLMLSDPRTGVALSHWSLPAVTRLNPGGTPAIYAPDLSGDETLELDDPTLMGAIETVRGALAAARPRPGRLRAGVVAGGLAVLALLAVFWLPDALVRQTASMVPDSKRAEIGRQALADITRVTGLPCSDPLGLTAASHLSDRLFGPGKGQILILRDAPRPATHLPGGLILLSRNLIETPDSPQVAAGFALAEQARADLLDPLVPVLRHAGLGATLRLLTSGTLPPTALAGYAETLLTAAPGAVVDQSLLAAFTAAEVASGPYARAVDPSGATVQPLIDGDPFRDTLAPPLLSDEDWVSLQAICQT
jgi:hypothetical protein